MTTDDTQELQDAIAASQAIANDLYDEALATPPTMTANALMIMATDERDRSKARVLQVAAAQMLHLVHLQKALNS